MSQLYNINLCFYTCFYGSNQNDSFVIPEVPSLKYDCYYYTNNNDILKKIQNTKWIGIFDNQKTNDDIIESNMAGKKVKVLPHKYTELEKYDYTCFLDSKLKKVSESFVEDFIIKYFIKQDYMLLLRKHWFIENSVWNEYNVSMLQYRYKMTSDRYINYINEQISCGLSDVTDNHCACGFLIRNMKHKKVKEFNETWYNHILKCGIQDQISFFFVKQLFSKYIKPFDEIPFI
jgi:hypothetical protein